MPMIIRANNRGNMKRNISIDKLLKPIQVLHASTAITKSSLAIGDVVSLEEIHNSSSLYSG